MSPIIYPSPIFGPIHSRRLGISLGINLMPADGKRCTFDCIYCECGYNQDHPTSTPYPSRESVRSALRTKLEEMGQQGISPNVLTFAGNGEPTAHPHFHDIVDDVIALRDQYYPEAKVSVLSNATMIGRPTVRKALLKVDNNIQKLDTVDSDYIRSVNRPLTKYSVERQIELLSEFNGHVIVQTMFMSATLNGQNVDNTEERFVGPWLDALRRIAPQQVMIYTIDRETPDHTLRKTPREKLDQIAERIRAIGIPASASY